MSFVLQRAFLTPPRALQGAVCDPFSAATTVHHNGYSGGARMTASMKKLTAGNGYEYLINQVAANDITDLDDEGGLAGYYSAKGERPGRWTGSGMRSLAGFDAAGPVTKEHMQALFGTGRHPDADALEHRERERLKTEGADDETIATVPLEISKLGTPYTESNDKPTSFTVAVVAAYKEYVKDPANHGSLVYKKDDKKRHHPSIPATARAQIRTTAGQETFAATYGRDPLNDRELTDHITRESRPRDQPVAGYDITFSPAKSISMLWAFGSQQQRRAVEEAHDQAVHIALDWIEDNALFTRRGKGGIRRERTTGLIAATFTHRDSRSGDPDLHTHVAISNKVQDPSDGNWLTIDGTPLYKAKVTFSEVYNGAVEQLVRQNANVLFAPREQPSDGKRPVREIVGIPRDWCNHMSKRRVAIVDKMESLSATFRAEHGRAPTPTESLALAQQANLDTRDAKHEPRSHEDQANDWNTDLAAHVAAHSGDLEDPVPEGIDPIAYRMAHLPQASPAPAELAPDGEPQTPEQVHAAQRRGVSDLAGRAIHAAQTRRATFLPTHIESEVRRVVDDLGQSRQESVQLYADVLNEVYGQGQLVLRIDPDDPVHEPQIARLPDGAAAGESKLHETFGRHYTTRAILDAEQRIVATAVAPADRWTVSQQTVAIALLEAAANNPDRPLDTSQVQMVTAMATSGKRLQLAQAPAGAGKSTTMRVLARSWQDSGGTVVGLSPTAVAAHVLRNEIGTVTDNLAKLAHHARGGPGLAPDWMTQIGPDTLVIIDEAGMASTLQLDTAIHYITSRGGSVRLVGDDRQLAAVSAGGVLRDIEATAGALTLSELHRFKGTPGEASATLALRDGNAQEALGFMLDNQRIHPTAAPDQAQALYEAHQGASTDPATTALMIAHTHEDVRTLNARARADRVSAGLVERDTFVRLPSGLAVSAGDRIVTKQIDRKLRMMGTDFVKNGDRWSVQRVHPDGSLQVCHEGHGAVVNLPPEYVTQHVDLAYAATVHGAQGQTVDHSFLMVTGSEDRNLLYVALSRGRYSNHVFVPYGGDGDEHAILEEDILNPRTGAEFLHRIIDRDGSAVSATTTRERLHDPSEQLATAGARYDEALRMAAVDVIGAKRMQQMYDEAHNIVPRAVTAPAWDTLHAHLAMIELDGGDPIAALAQAADFRALDTARDVAAVLDWRLDTTGGHSSGTGPLPWLAGIPQQLRDHRDHGPWLSARADRAARFAGTVSENAHAWSTEDLPDWAIGLDGHPDLLANVAVWRASHRIPTDDLSPTGPRHPSLRHRHHQQQLDQQAVAVLGASNTHPGAQFRDLLRQQAPSVLSDPWWPVMGARLDIAVIAGVDVHHQLADKIAPQPLPEVHPAAALWSRLVDDLTPRTTVTTRAHAATRLRPPWREALADALPAGLIEHVTSSPSWPALVAAVTTTSRETGHAPEHVITGAVQLLGQSHLPTAPGLSSDHSEHEGRLPLSALAMALTWRVRDLSAPPDEHDLLTENDIVDADVEDFLAQIAAEHDTATSTDNPPPSTQERPGTEPDPDLVHDEPEPDVAPVTSRDRILELNRSAGAFYAAAYPDSPAQTYLTDRFGTDPAAGPYLLGYASKNGTALIEHLRTEAAATDDELVDAGLASWSARGWFHDFFFNRALIGVHDHEGNLAGFNGRDLGNSDRKYLNTKATVAFTKGRTLGGLHEGLTAARAAGIDQPGLVRVEGPMDALAITLAGDGKMIGVYPGGTAFTDAHADQLAAHALNGRVWEALDHDAAGLRALTKELPALLDRDLDVRLIPYALKNDPAASYQADPDLMRLILNTAHDHPGIHAVHDITDAIAAEPRLRPATSPPGEWNDLMRNMATHLAQLPPNLWDDEISVAARNFPASTTDDPEHYATLLYTHVIAAATNSRDLLDDDYRTLLPDPDRTQSTLHELRAQMAAARAHAATPARDRAFDELDRRVAQQADPTPLPPAAPDHTITGPSI